MRFTRFVRLLALAALVAAALFAPVGSANPLRDPTPNAPEAVDEMHRVTFAEPMTSFTLASTFVMYELQFPQIGSRSAEDIRNTISLYQPMLEEALVTAVHDSLAQSFPNALVDVRIVARDMGRSNGDLDPYHPGIVYKTESKVTLTTAYFFGQDVPGLNLDELILGTFRMGGTFVADLKLAPAAGHLTNIAVSVPSWLVVENAAKDGLFHATADNRSANLPMKSIGLRIHAPDLGARLARFTGSGGDVSVKVDMHDAHVPLDALSGGEGTLAIDVDVTVDLYHLEITEDLQGILPPFIEMGYANADYLRLAVQNGLILEQPFADSLVRLVEWNLHYVLGDEAEVVVDRALLDSTLHSAYDPSTMEAKEPVKVVAHAKVVKKVPILGDDATASDTPATMAGLLGSVTSRLAPSTYVIKGFYSWDTRYTFLFPGGMDADVSDALGRGERRSGDGRDAYRLTVTGGEYDEVTIGGTLGAMFFAQAVVGTDTPAQTGLVLVGGLLVALGLAALVTWRLKRRKFAAALRVAPRTVLWGPSGAPLAAPVVVGKRARAPARTRNSVRPQSPLGISR